MTRIPLPISVQFTDAVHPGVYDDSLQVFAADGTRVDIFDRANDPTVLALTHTDGVYEIRFTDPSPRPAGSTYRYVAYTDTGDPLCDLTGPLEESRG